MTTAVTVEHLVEGIEALLSLPDAVTRASELIESDSAGAAEIADVISLDPALSAQLLKLVNSAFYALPSKIDTISRAITLIGVKELQTLIYSASAVSIFNKIAPEAISMDDFWFHSVYVGVAAKIVAADRKKAEMMFLMGLLHNVGKIVLFIQAEEQANRIIEASRDSEKTLAEIEQEILGFTSVDISAQLLKNWGLGENLWGPMQHMFHPEKAGAHEQDARVLQFAHRLADCVEPELKTQDPAKVCVLGEDEKLLGRLGIAADDLEDLMDRVNVDCLDVVSIVIPDAMLVF